MKTTVLVMEQTKRHSEIRKQKARIKTSPKGPSAPVSVCCYELYMLTFVLFIELDQIIIIIITMVAIVHTILKDCRL